MAGHAEGPVPSFPVRLGGPVMKGFGRGSKELGIPTANIPTDGLTVDGRDLLQSGIYYGWAGLESAHTGKASALDKAKELGARVVGGLGTVALGSTAEDEVDESATGHIHHGKAYPMVMSVGWNPFYKNTVRSVEVHIIHQFEYDFYDRNLNVVVLGFLRPEKDYDSKEALIADIRGDIEAAGKHLAQPENAKFAKDEYLFKHSKASVQGEAAASTS